MLEHASLRRDIGYENAFTMHTHYRLKFKHSNLPVSSEWPDSD